MCSRKRRSFVWKMQYSNWEAQIIFTLILFNVGCQNFSCAWGLVLLEVTSVQMPSFFLMLSIRYVIKGKVSIAAMDLLIQELVISMKLCCARGKTNYILQNCSSEIKSLFYISLSSNPPCQVVTLLSISIMNLIFCKLSSLVVI